MIQMTTDGRPILGRSIALLLASALLFPGCVSSGYRAARKDTPAPQVLNVGFPPGRFDATLISVITYNGPGSWKRNAFWDEYVVTIRNTGSDPMTIGAAGLTDSAGTIRAAGIAPWALEEESKRLEDKYPGRGYRIRPLHHARFGYRRDRCGGHSQRWNLLDGGSHGRNSHSRRSAGVLHQRSDDQPFE